MVKTVRRRRLVDVQHRVVFGTFEAVQQVLAAHGWQINTAFIERLNLTIRQHVAAGGRRVTTLCKGEDGVRQQLGLYHVYYNWLYRIWCGGILQICGDGSQFAVLPRLNDRKLSQSGLESLSIVCRRSILMLFSHN